MSQTPPPPPPTAQSGGTGAIGELRKPLTVVLLTIVTCGIYLLWWYYRNFEDMKQYSGEGIGGARRPAARDLLRDHRDLHPPRRGREPLRA